MIDIGLINPGVGAHKTEVVPRDDKTRPLPNDRRRFAQDEFDEAGVLVRLRGQVCGVRRYIHIDEVYQSILGKGYDLLCDDDDVSVLELQVC